MAQEADDGEPERAQGHKAKSSRQVQTTSLSLFRGMGSKAVLVVCVVFMACTKRNEAVLVPQETGSSTRIVINEVLATGSTDVNEFVERSDWLDLFNAGTGVHLDEAEWYLTDNRENLLKSEQPTMMLEAGEHLLIWCDGGDVVENDIHASFHLAAEDEWLALVHASEGRACIIDPVSYVKSDEDRSRSVGRMPDGARQWIPMEESSPGEQNVGLTGEAIEQ